MRSGLTLSFGTLALLVAFGCSSRGGENLFTGEAAHDGVDEGAAGSPDDGEGGEGGNGGHEGVPDGGPEEDAGESDASSDAEPGDIVSELPPAEISCGSEICTTPDEYCCRPSGNVAGPSITVSCKPKDAECRFGGVGGFGGVSGTPQYCSSHDQCAGGQCCAIRKSANDRSYTSVECQAKCQGAEVEACDPENPDCSQGTCKKSGFARDLYVCQA